METKNEKTIDSKNRESEIIRQIVEENSEMEEKIIEEMYQERFNLKEQKNAN